MLTGRQLSCFRESKLPNSKPFFSGGETRVIHSVRRTALDKGCTPLQETGSTLPTTKRYELALISRLTHTQTKAKKNEPVLSTMNPVTTGAAIPARFPAQFWMPVHLPAANAPARVCVIAQRLPLYNP